jgi:DNA-binding CsgD family transcriptional regulator
MHRGQRELDLMLTLVREAASSCGNQPFEIGVIDKLMELVPADRAGYYELPVRADGRPSRGTVNTYSCERPRYEMCWDDETVSATIASWPLWEPHVVGARQALFLSDFQTRAEQRRNPWYVEVQRANDAEFECKLLLPAPPGTVRGFFFVRGRGRRDFDEDDRAILDLLRPQLAALRESWERRTYPPLLTRRETEVLQLVAEGLTNSAIAKRLYISPATVRAHLEHIFEKLNVHTRTAAVAAAFHERSANGGSHNE